MFAFYGGIFYSPKIQGRTNELRTNRYLQGLQVINFNFSNMSKN